MESADEKDIGHVWCGDEDDVRERSDFWVGETICDKLHHPPPGYGLIWGRPTMKPNTAHPRDNWQNMRMLMSTNQKKKAAADWRVMSGKVNEARQKTGISAEVHVLSMLNL